MADPYTIGSTALAAFGALTGKQKKPKGVQKQFYENVGFIQAQLREAIQAYLGSITASAGQEGAALATRLQGVLGRTGAGATGAGAVAQGIGRSYAGSRALQARGRAKYETSRDVLNLAGQVAGASGQQPAAGPSPIDTFFANLGQYLLTKGGSTPAGVQAASSVGGVRMPGTSLGGPQPSYDAMRQLSSMGNFTGYNQNQKFGRRP